MPIVGVTALPARAGRASPGIGYILHHRYHAAFLSLLSIAVMTHILALSMTSSEMGCGSSWDLVTPLSEVASMKFVPSHPSLTSMSTEPTRRIIDSTDGKTLMTLALRFISSLARSCTLFVRRLEPGYPLGGLAVGGADELRVALGEDGPHGRRGDGLVLPLGEPACHVALQVDDAALPGRTLEDLGDGLDETPVVVGDHALDAGDAPPAQAAQKRLPRRR